MGNYPWPKSCKMWKGNGDTTTLLFSLKGLEILHQDRRRQVNTKVMQHFKSILFKFRPANKQHTYQPFKIWCELWLQEANCWDFFAKENRNNHNKPHWNRNNNNKPHGNGNNHNKSHENGKYRGANNTKIGDKSEDLIKTMKRFPGERQN